MSASDVYRALRSAGASPEEAMVLTAIAGPESGWNTGAYNGNGERSVGVFQVNLDAHEGAKIPGSPYTVTRTTMANLDLSARYALSLFRSQGPGPWSVTGLRAGTSLKINESHLSQARTAAQTFGDAPLASSDIMRMATGGANATVGSTGQDLTGSSVGLPGVADRYPAGGEVLNGPDGPVLRYQTFPGVWAEWLVTDMDALANSGYNAGAAKPYYQPPGQLVDYKAAGDARELGELVYSGYDTVAEFMDATINLYFSPFDPARSNPEIQAVIARVMANPDAPEALIDAWIQQTEWWNQTADLAKEWNSLPQAEQAQRVQTQASLIEQEFWASTGERASLSDPRISKWAQEVASGAKTFSQVTQEIRDLALSNTESPFSRSIRTEQVNQRQFGVDIENTAEAVRQEAARWGIQLSTQSSERWARQIELNESSQADFEKYLQDTSAIMFPWKDRNVATIDAAAPWLEAYRRTMEIGAVDLTNPDIMRALQSGTTLPDFEAELRRKPEWFKTKNARDTLSSTFGQIGRLMEFI